MPLTASNQMIPGGFLVRKKNETSNPPFPHIFCPGHSGSKYLFPGQSIGDYAGASI